ncbi:hypothetical protein [Sulfolobus acidocaldarius]|uniref:Uncharacterized protein n=2 Tax=Sulfolobus acidocaldarius TaxID=2285 RepID=A0A0U3HD71_9CREN|nr:hypothetical protein [Sulfolobus acidocaldarius]AAY81306.1 hypothetical membrane protein [Sulfolobus acidocaldarius DSM 639]ALU29891.1 hypothetical protein ATY89_08035 [Sulfolobus acidocaldarius]ALU32631.1 hypothetical protein ATZ20_11055 [Sulfolobus acidocaldarius]
MSSLYFYSHEFRLAVFSLVCLVAIHYAFTYFYPHDLISEVIVLVSVSVFSSLISLVFLRGFEPGKYLLCWYWAYFINLFFLGTQTLYPLDLGTLNPVAWAFLFSILSLIVTTIVRLIRRGDEISSSLSAYQLWASTVYYTGLLYASQYILPSLLKFLVPILFLSYVLSFFAFRLSKSTYFNLCLVGLFLTAIYMSKNAIVNADRTFLLFLFVFSLAYYYLTMRVVLINTENGLYGGVVSSYTSTIFFPLSVVVVWYFVHEFLLIFPPVNANVFLSLFLPSAIGSVLVDTLKGRKLPSGIVGGVGMADGLWLDMVNLVLYYLFIIKFGVLDGSILYLVVSLLILRFLL